jgi:hypothetical protein
LSPTSCRAPVSGPTKMRPSSSMRRGCAVR